MFARVFRQGAAAAVTAGQSASVLAAARPVHALYRQPAVYQQMRWASDAAASTFNRLRADQKTLMKVRDLYKYFYLYMHRSMGLDSVFTCAYFCSMREDGTECSCNQHLGLQPVCWYLLQYMCLSPTSGVFFLFLPFHSFFF